MSNIDTMIEMNSTNQDLFVELNEKDAETISGGIINCFDFSERFTIYNQTNVRIPYTIDGTRTSRPDGDSVWTTDGGGIIAFDLDFGQSGVQLQRYNLSNGSKYAFRYNTDTSNPNDIELYRIG